MSRQCDRHGRKDKCLQCFGKETPKEIFTSLILQPNVRYIFATYILLSKLSYMFRCVINHSQGELRIRHNNCRKEAF